MIPVFVGVYGRANAVDVVVGVRGKIWFMCLMVCVFLCVYGNMWLMFLLVCVENACDSYDCWFLWITEMWFKCFCCVWKKHMCLMCSLVLSTDNNQYMCSMCSLVCIDNAHGCGSCICWRVWETCGSGVCWCVWQRTRC